MKGVYDPRCQEDHPAMTAFISASTNEGADVNIITTALVWILLALLAISNYVWLIAFHH